MTSATELAADGHLETQPVSPGSNLTRALVAALCGYDAAYQETPVMNAYPHAPASGKTDTSHEAAEHVAPFASRIKKEILEALAEAPMTTSELCNATGIGYSALQPRTSELRQLALIRDSGARRMNDSGRSTIVWELAPQKRQG